ncbi:uncharacterized protein Z519_03926 [Cladophialophora bantiana CBS 173.52]|uniref:Uncharacterized protein n=1 Tax=Cladophialophora bantiana (strain ATCC 10958 / CBS 173.52 / CDC B-1940 / NIH 8579) TaxID=1442370 RepID=A0A0D2G9P2_CLAB1|nr:uncharacterized protein Z519_03926 [Cladophialophora bantiana CBS 173.52]KIW95342.1 hypothetical protein Z519_03926 [Cladophialophora bantiana CBS 173.52]
MPPFRMPFTSKRPAAPIETTNDENARPNSFDGNVKSPYSRDKPSLALGVKEKTVEPNEFKLSSVNDSGEYLPPSPTEKQSFWAKSPSSTSTNHRQCFNDNDAFTISRESFESYRRSFDISGRSPILQTDSFTSRTSLDSRPATRFPTRSTLSSTTFERPTAEEDPIFEDVKLNDEANKQQEPKKKSFLSRFGDSNGETITTTAATKEEGKHHFHFLPGRKRGQSGTGNELGDIPRPQSRGNAEVIVR